MNYQSLAKNMLKQQKSSETEKSISELMIKQLQK
jgi:hypothetical protein